MSHSFDYEEIIALNDKRLMKQGIWLYFLLLIFEGALRKWVLPGLATPLLIIRDPIAIALIVMALRRRLLTINYYLFLMVSAGVIGIFTALFFGHGSLPVAIFGARILLVHFPFMFVINKIFNKNDVIQLGKVCLWISIPMTVLIALQFYSPQSAWVNRGVGGDTAGGGFSGALEFYRPPATFSFTNGTSLYYSFCAPFVFYFWLNTKGINKWMLSAATISLLAAIPLSISRTLFFSVGVSSLFVVFAILRNPKYMGGLVAICVAVVIAMIFLSKTSFFETATRAFTVRFESANEQEGGVRGVLGSRYFGALTEAIDPPADLPFFGYGIGIGTNVGSMLLAGKRLFLVAEGEWGRLIGEMGLLIGLTVILIRLFFCARVTLAAYQHLLKDDLLPWLLLSFGLLTIPQAQWAQPTALGFSTLIGGLLLASFHSPLKRNF